MPSTETLRIEDLPRIRAANFTAAYANHVEAFPGFYEISVLFCRIQRNTGGETVSEQQAEITMTWEQALRVRDLLDRLVKGYEAQHGSIRLMDDPREAEQGPPGD